jgi:hypothetical protein
VAPVHQCHVPHSEFAQRNGHEQRGDVHRFRAVRR